MSDASNDTLVILGAGEHASVVTDAAREGPWHLQGFAAPDATHTETLDDLPYLGDDPTLAAYLEAKDTVDAPALVIAFGGVDATPTRRRVADRYPTARFATIVHPAAWVSRSATLGPGTVVLARAVVNTGAVVGSHAVVNSGAIVEHDAQIGDFVQLSPGSIIGGGARLASGVFVGLGAVVRDHLHIGADAVIGMGAVVVEDVVAGTVVMGSPARPAARASTTT